MYYSMALTVVFYLAKCENTTVFKMNMQSQASNL